MIERSESAGVPVPDRRFAPETLAIHAGQIPDAETGARLTPDA